MAYAGKTQRRIVSAWIGTAFTQDDASAARKQWREVADQARPRLPKLATLMAEAEADVLAHMDFPVQHRAKILHQSDRASEPRDQAAQRCRRYLPNEQAVTRLIGGLPYTHFIAEGQVGSA